MFLTPLSALRSVALVLLTVLLIAPQAQAVRVFFDYRVFHLPGEGPYLEVFTSFDPESMRTMAGENGLIYSAELTLILSRGNEVADFRKVVVTHDYSPGDDEPFLSLERLAVPNGTYDLELKVRDLAAPNEKAESYRQQVVIGNLTEGLFVSDVQFIRAYTPTEEINAFSKSGYDLIPFVSSHFPSELTQLVYYAEIYQSDNYFGDGQPFVSSVCITDVLNREVAECKRVKKEKAAVVVPMLQVIDIRNLPTGEYKLRIEIRDRQNEVVTWKERRFTRSLVQAVEPDPLLVSDDVLSASFAARYTHNDSLYAIIQSHHPVAKNVERNTIDYQLKGADLRTLQSFFYSFWLRRNPQNPEQAWREYEVALAKVQETFGTRIKKGWETDRGRVYLRYGAPNTRIVRYHDPDYWPFEIWHYYETNTGLRNRRLLFYNTALTYDLELLHSDIPDEIQNPDWRRLVRSRETTRPADVGRITSQQLTDPYSGDEIEDLWYNPR